MCCGNTKVVSGNVDGISARPKLAEEVFSGPKRASVGGYRVFQRGEPQMSLAYNEKRQERMRAALLT
jgi:hypothetical protein